MSENGESIAILLIEDNPGDVRLLREHLNEATDRSSRTAELNVIETYDLRHSTRLDEGLQQLEEEDIDVVLLDLGLPDSTGISTLEAVRDRAREVPIVVLTGLDDETVGIRAVQQGAQEYLTKGELTPMLLRRSIQHAIERTKFDRTQTALHDASRDLIQTESKAEVGQLTVDTAVNVLDLPGIAIYRFDESANVLEPIASTDYIESIFGGLPSFSPGDSAITWQSFITGETITFDDIRESEHIYQEDTSFRSGIWIPLGDHGVMAILSEQVGGIDQQTKQLADHLAATAEAALTRVEREASLRESEREMAQQNRQLEELNRMNELIREIDQVLIQATTREAIEQAVCERIARDDRFGLAWIGEVVDEQLRPRTWSGSNQGYLDTVSLSTAADNPPPAVTTATTGTATVTPNVAADLGNGSWRKEALARNISSVISVPLSYKELSYGVLTVFAHEPDVFDARSKEVFEELGETISNAMNSVETREALLSDTIVELELAIREPEDVLSRLAREIDCQIEYGGIVPQPGGTNRLFFGASGAPASSIAAVVEEISSVQRLDRISDADGDSGETRFEVTVSGPTIPSTFVECGGVARSIEITESEVRAIVELPESTDIRTFINRYEETYPNTELLARRDRERDDRSQEAFETSLTGELTSRQLETLQTAYYSGYFEWPRDRTGEEVAESLGITQPTFNSHLRSAERKLCTLLFDDTSSSSE